MARLSSNFSQNALAQRSLHRYHAAVLVTYILAFFTVLSLVLTLWQWLVATNFPLDERISPPAITPGVAILKPLKGKDSRTAECLRSWCQQDYHGPIQILFGVASANDPVCALVHELLRDYPHLDAQLVICSERLGANAKVSTLVQLQRLAKHEVMVISDADVYVPRDLLQQVVARLQQPGVALVNCFYRLTNMSNFPMRWESFAINADFWSQVLQACSLKRMDFAMGAVMASTKTWLERIGGFNSLVDYLADDYQLGNKIARSGGQITICPVVVECHSATLGWKEVWSHQKRWARTIRVCQPVPYFFSKLSNATFWPLLWMVCDPGLRSYLFGAGCLLVRMGAAWYCERKLTNRSRISSLWLAPVKDVLQIAIWMLAFTGNRITWRGQEFKVQPTGKLVKV